MAWSATRPGRDTPGPTDSGIGVEEAGFGSRDAGSAPQGLVPFGSRRTGYRPLTVIGWSRAAGDRQPASIAGGPGVDQRQELVARFFPIAERAEHSAGHRSGVLLLYAAHHDAEVPRLANDAHAHRLDQFLNGLRDLLCQALLDLQAPRKNVHNARQLTEPDHAVTRDISDVDLAEKRQHMVLAHAEELDVLHDDHLVVLHGKQRAVDDFVDVRGITAGEEL